ncbi:hypothetical protein LCGC14_2242920, partial [marine sediment metagenome]
RSTKSKSLAAAAYAQKADSIEIEEEATREGGAFQDYLSLTYGPPKIGKSTLWSLFPGVYFLPTEPGYKSLKVRKSYIPNWGTFIKFVTTMERKPKLYRDISIFCLDTVDNLSKFCLQYVCGREDIAHPADQEWGKGWEAFRDEFTHWILRLCALGPGVSFISHQNVREVIFHGVKMPKETPAMPKTSYTVINNLVDIILKISYVGKLKSRKDVLSTKRCIYTQPTAMYDAGDRTGNLPEKIVFKTEKEAVRIILDSFKKKTKTGKHERRSKTKSRPRNKKRTR